MGNRHHDLPARDAPGFHHASPTLPKMRLSRNTPGGFHARRPRGRLGSVATKTRKRTPYARDNSRQPWLDGRETGASACSVLLHNQSDCAALFTGWVLKFLDNNPHLWDFVPQAWS